MLLVANDFKLCGITFYFCPSIHFYSKFHSKYAHDAETYGPYQALQKFNDKQVLVSIKPQLGGPGKGEKFRNVYNCEIRKSSFGR